MSRDFDVMVAGHLCLDIIPRFHDSGARKLEEIMRPGKLVNVALPATVDLTVTETEPALKGATVTNVLKPATLETGLKVRVPPFISQGEKVRIDTRTGEYLERAKG